MKKLKHISLILIVCALCSCHKAPVPESVTASDIENISRTQFNSLVYTNIQRITSAIKFSNILALPEDQRKEFNDWKGLYILDNNYLKEGVFEYKTNGKLITEKGADWKIIFPNYVQENPFSSVTKFIGNDTLYVKTNSEGNLQVSKRYECNHGIERYKKIDWLMQIHLDNYKDFPVSGSFNLQTSYKNLKSPYSSREYYQLNLSIAQMNFKDMNFGKIVFKGQGEYNFYKFGKSYDETKAFSNCKFQMNYENEIQKFNTSVTFLY